MRSVVGDDRIDRTRERMLTIGQLAADPDRFARALVAARPWRRR